MEELIAETIAARRFNMLMLGLFAALALSLSAIGVYGVISYSVGERTREIGVRLALGAQRKDILRLVVGQGMKLAFVGVAIGIAGALAATRFLEGLLFGVSPSDPLTLVAISTLLIGVAFMACYLPARRAMRVDPLVALRCD